MKKIISVILGVVLVLSILSVNVYAATGVNEYEQSILDKLKAGVTVDGKAFNLSDAQLNQAEIYFKRDGVEVTKEQADTIVAELDKAIAEFKKAGGNSTDLSKLPAASRKVILEAAKSAVGAINLTLTYDASGNSVTIKDTTGTVVAENKGIIKTTGADFSAMLVLPLIILAVVALGFAVSKKAKLFVK